MFDTALGLATMAAGFGFGFHKQRGPPLCAPSDQYLYKCVVADRKVTVTISVALGSKESRYLCVTVGIPKQPSPLDAEFYLSNLHQTMHKLHAQA